MDVREGLMIERATLTAFLAAREGKEGYSVNVAALKARIAEIEALLSETANG